MFTQSERSQYWLRSLFHVCVLCVSGVNCVNNVNVCVCCVCIYVCSNRLHDTCPTLCSITKTKNPCFINIQSACQGFSSSFCLLLYRHLTVPLSTASQISKDLKCMFSFLPVFLSKYVISNLWSLSNIRIIFIIY